MNYRFKRREPLAHGFARIAREEIHGALAELGVDSADAPSAEGVHEARRKLKKLRALLRLMRPALGEDAFARADSIAKEAGRALSPVRDAAVQLAALGALLGTPAACAEKRSHQTKQTMVAANAAIARLRTLQAGIEPPPVPDETALLCGSLRRAYRRSRNALGAAIAHPSDETLHALRKRVKSLQNQLLLIRRAAPQRSKRMLGQLDQMGEQLGTDRDIALLASALASDATIGTAAFRNQIDRRRRKLQRKALQRAESLFAAKPAAWLKPFARAWKRWHGRS